MRLALGSLLVALAAVPSAAAETVALDWRESYYPDYPRAHRITFRVTRVEASGNRWTVHAAFTNRTPWRLGVVPYDASGWEAGMELVSWRPREGTWYPWDPLPGPDRFRGTRFVPALPRSLAPGGSWSGRFSGSGELPQGRSIHVRFGRFVPPRRVAVRLRTDGLSWTTDHGFRL
jgi:hypothetical protein